MVFFALLCYNDLSKNRKVDAKMDYQKWAQEVAQKIKIKELEVAKRKWKNSIHGRKWCVE